MSSSAMILPEGWDCHFDPASQKMYYVDVKNGITQWEVPTIQRTVPPPPPTPPPPLQMQQPQQQPPLAAVPPRGRAVVIVNSIRPKAPEVNPAALDPSSTSFQQPRRSISESTLPSPTNNTPPAFDLSWQSSMSSLPELTESSAGGTNSRTRATVVLGTIRAPTPPIPVSMPVKASVTAATATPQCGSGTGPATTVNASPPADIHLEHAPLPAVAKKVNGSVRSKQAPPTVAAKTSHYIPPLPLMPTPMPTTKPIMKGNGATQAAPAPTSIPVTIPQQNPQVTSVFPSPHGSLPSVPPPHDPLATSWTPHAQTPLPVTEARPAVVATAIPLATAVTATLTTNGGIALIHHQVPCAYPSTMATTDPYAAAAAADASGMHVILSSETVTVASAMIKNEPPSPPGVKVMNHVVMIPSGENFVANEENTEPEFVVSSSKKITTTAAEIAEPEVFVPNANDRVRDNIAEPEFVVPCGNYTFGAALVEPEPECVVHAQHGHNNGAKQITTNAHHLTPYIATSSITTTTTNKANYSGYLPEYPGDNNGFVPRPPQYRYSISDCYQHDSVSRPPPYRYSTSDCYQHGAVQKPLQYRHSTSDCYQHGAVSKPSQYRYSTSDCYQNHYSTELTDHTSTTSMDDSMYMGLADGSMMDSSSSQILESKIVHVLERVEI